MDNLGDKHLVPEHLTLAENLVAWWPNHTLNQNMCFYALITSPHKNSLSWAVYKYLFIFGKYYSHLFLWWLKVSIGEQIDFWSICYNKRWIMLQLTKRNWERNISIPQQTEGIRSLGFLFFLLPSNISHSAHFSFVAANCCMLFKICFFPAFFLYKNRPIEQLKPG